jgi:hypothetical protein
MTSTLPKKESKMITCNLILSLPQVLLSFLSSLFYGSASFASATTLSAPIMQICEGVPRARGTKVDICKM